MAAPPRSSGPAPAPMRFNPCSVGLGMAAPPRGRLAPDQVGVSILVLLDWEWRPRKRALTKLMTWMFQSLFCWIGNGGAVAGCHGARR